jgi:hypothetical protein
MIVITWDMTALLDTYLVSGLGPRATLRYVTVDQDWTGWDETNEPGLATAKANREVGNARMRLIMYFQYFVILSSFAVCPPYLSWCLRTMIYSHVKRRVRHIIMSRILQYRWV